MQKYLKGIIKVVHMSRAEFWLSELKRQISQILGQIIQSSFVNYIKHCKKTRGGHRLFFLI